MMANQTLLPLFTETFEDTLVALGNEKLALDIVALFTADTLSGDLLRELSMFNNVARAFEIVYVLKEYTPSRYKVAFTCDDGMAIGLAVFPMGEMDKSYFQCMTGRVRDNLGNWLIQMEQKIRRNAG
jgi:hypothetical protein